ncbi:MAG: hypothetical protein JWO82_3206 [Akkermansiaceae bacterium]|nr:hypothetical protein [Akkermansiaceae bacterium]
MPDAAEKFIHAALAAAPSDKEVRQHLAAELTALAATAGDPSLEEATRLLKEGRLPRSTRQLWKAISAAMVLTAIACMAANAWHFHTYRQTASQLIGSWGGKITAPDDSTIPGISAPTPHQRLLLLGDPGHLDKPDQFQGLSLSAPDNPVYYGIFIRKLLSRQGALPGDFVERVQATDPGNGILFLTAMESASKSVRADKLTGSHRIVDPAEFDRAMRYFHLAAAAPFLRDRIEDGTGERVAAMPPARDFLSMLSQIGFVLTQEGVYSSVPFSIASLLPAAAEKCQADHDPGAFRQLSAEWRAISEKLVRDEPVSLIDLIIKRATLMAVSKSFATVATDLGLNEESTYYSNLGAALGRLKQEIDASRHQAEATYSYTRGDSLLPMSKGTLIPEVPAADLAPERLTLHAFLQRVTAFLGCGLFLIIGGGVAAYRFRGSALSRSLALISFRMSWRKTLPPATTAALVPLLLFQLHVWSPWGASYWNAFWGGLILTNLQALAALILALLLPLCVVRRFHPDSGKSIRFAEAPGHRRGEWFGWGAAICGAAAWILASVVPYLSGFDALFTHDFGLFAGVGKPTITDSCGIAIWTATGLLGLGAVYLAFIAIRALISSRARLPLRLTVAKLLLFPYLAALLFLGLLQPVLHAVEVHWATHDPINGIDPLHPAVGRGEYRTMIPTYARLRQLLQEAAESS